VDFQTGTNNTPAPRDGGEQVLPWLQKRYSNGAGPRHANAAQDDDVGALERNVRTR